MKVIKKSFLVTGISNKEDGSENDFFKGYQKLNEFIEEDNVDLNIENLEDIILLSENKKLNKY